jgi:hypothetical protein
VFCENNSAFARSRYRETWTTDCSMNSAASLTSPKMERACQQALGHISCAAVRTSAPICRPEESNSRSHQTGAFLASSAISHPRAKQANTTKHLVIFQRHRLRTHVIGDGNRILRSDFRGRLQRGWRIGKCKSEVAVASSRVVRVDSTAIVAHTITDGLVADAESRGLA